MELSSNLKPWKPGQSGNPIGTKPGTRQVFSLSLVRPARTGGEVKGGPALENRGVSGRTQKGGLNSMVSLGFNRGTGAGVVGDMEVDIGASSAVRGTGLLH
jgi:hypothetical protein